MLTAWISGSIAVLDAMRGWPDGLSNWVVAGLAAYCAYVVQLWWLLRRLGNFGWLTALTYPVSLAFFVVVFLRSLSLTLTRQSVRWKGRVIPLRSSR